MLVGKIERSPHSSYDFSWKAIGKTLDCVTIKVDRLARCCLDFLHDSALRTILDLKWYTGIELLKKLNWNPSHTLIEKLFSKMVEEGNQMGWESIAQLDRKPKHALYLAEMKKQVKKGNPTTLRSLAESLGSIKLADYIDLIKIAIFYRKKEMLMTLVGGTLPYTHQPTDNILDYVRILQMISESTGSTITLSGHGIKIHTSLRSVENNLSYTAHILIGVALFARMMQEGARASSLKTFTEFLYKIKAADEYHLKSLFIQSLLNNKWDRIDFLLPVISKSSTKYFLIASTIALTLENAAPFNKVIQSRNAISDLEFSMIVYALGQADKWIFYSILAERCPWLSNYYIQTHFINISTARIISHIELLLNNGKKISTVFIEELLQGYIETQQSEILQFLLENHDYIDDIYENICPSLLFSAMQNAENNGDVHLIVALYLQSKKYFSFRGITRYLNVNFLPFLPYLSLPARPNRSLVIEKRKRAARMLPARI